MAKHKLTPEQRQEVRKEAQEKVAAGTPRSEVVKAIVEQYGITPVSARNYLPDGARAKKSKPKPKAKRKPARKTNRKSAPKRRAKVRRSQVSKARRSPASRPKVGFRIMQVVAKLSESDLKKALGAKRLWSERQELLARRQEVERTLRGIDGRVRSLDRRISRITAT